MRTVFEVTVIPQDGTPHVSACVAAYGLPVLPLGVQVILYEGVSSPVKRVFFDPIDMAAVVRLEPVYAVDQYEAAEIGKSLRDVGWTSSPSEA